MGDENPPTSHRLRGGIVQLGDLIISTSAGSVLIFKGNEVDNGREMEIFPLSPIRLLLPIDDPSGVKVGVKSFVLALGDRQLAIFRLKKIIPPVTIELRDVIVDIGTIETLNVGRVQKKKEEVFRVRLKIPIVYRSGRFKIEILKVDYSDNGRVKKSLKTEEAIECDGGKMKFCVCLNGREFFGIFEDTVVKSDGAVFRAGEISQKKKRRVCVVGRELWHDNVILATENGSIRVVKVEEGRTSNLSPKNRPLTMFSNGHCIAPHSTIRCREPATIISTETSVIVGSKRGEIFCLNEQLQLTRKFETNGGPISCLKLDQDDCNFLFIEFESGELRRVNLLVADENDSPMDEVNADEEEIVEDVEMDIEEEEEQGMAPQEVSIEEGEEKPTVEDLQKEVAVLQKKLDRRERLLKSAYRKVADAELLAEYAEEIIEDRMTEEAEKANEKKKMEELEKRLMDVIGENGKLKEENAKIKRFGDIMVKENKYIKQRLKEMKDAQTATPLAPPISFAEASLPTIPPEGETADNETTVQSALAPPIPLLEVSLPTIPPLDETVEPATTLAPPISPSEPSHPPMPPHFSDNESTVPTFTAPSLTVKKEEPIQPDEVPNADVSAVQQLPPPSISPSTAPLSYIPLSDNEPTVPTLTAPQLAVKNEEPIQHKDVPNAEPVSRRVHLPPPPSLSVFMAAFSTNPVKPSDIESTVPIFTAPAPTEEKGGSTEREDVHEDTKNAPHDLMEEEHPLEDEDGANDFQMEPLEIMNEDQNLTDEISEDRDPAMANTDLLNGSEASIEYVDGIAPAEAANNLKDEEEELDMADAQSTVTPKDTSEATVKEKRRRSLIDYSGFEQYTEPLEESEERECDGEGIKFCVRLTKKKSFGVFEDTIVKSDGSVFRAEEVSEKKKRRVSVVGRELWHGKVLLATENGSIRVVEVEEDGMNKMSDRGQCVEPFNSNLRCREPTVIISTMTTVIVGTKRGEIHVLDDQLQLTRKFETEGGPIKCLMLDQSDGVWVEYERGQLRRIDLLASDESASGATRSDMTLECPVCEHRARSVRGLLSHLDRSHSTNAYLAGCVFRCECGNESFSGHHSFFCKREVTVIRKNDGPIRTFHDEKTTPQCVLCNMYPKTAYAYVRHLERHHKSTLKMNGIFFICSCGLQVRSNRDHKKKCTGRGYTLHYRDKE